MDLTRGNLSNLFTGFQATFQQGLGAAQTQHDLVAMTVPSSTAVENYGWMKDIPGLREWLGERVVHSLTASDYSIRNKPFELTVGVDRDTIEDDRYGIYSGFIQEMGRQTAEFPSKLVFALLKDGFTTPGYDGQYFFDADHPVLNEAGEAVSVGNIQAGAGTPWFLMDLSRSLKPIIFQNRKDFRFVRMDTETDEAVFQRREYRYGVDGRCNVGFAFWQLAYASKAALTAENYAAARAAMGSLKRDYGTPLAIRPTHLVVPPSLEGAANKLMKNDQIDGSDNEWKGTATPVVVPWLA